MFQTSSHPLIPSKEFNFKQSDKSQHSPAWTFCQSLLFSTCSNFPVITRHACFCGYMSQAASHHMFPKAIALSARGAAKEWNAPMNLHKTLSFWC